MRHATVWTASLPALLLTVLFSPLVLAQASGAPEWLPCPRCQSPAERAESRRKYEVDNRPFNARDISGIWGNNGVELNIFPPPFTPRGKEMYDATRADETAAGVAVSNSKDGMLICDPLGYPRWFAYNYGFQFVVLPDRVLQFFELGHTWRDIWTDGRSLPDDPPQPRWLGYAVGRWEGNTLVVESNGYDDRSWLQEDRRDRRWGFPHTDQLRVVERYTRTSFGTLDAELTIIDPVVFKKPWTTKAAIPLSAGTELWEYMCVPSENEAFNAQKLRPQTGVAK
jgi:hypothetical protein